MAATTARLLATPCRLLMFLLLAAALHLPHVLGLQTAKQWKLFNYNFLPDAPTSDTNFFNPTNIIATGVAVSHDRIFIATPKLFSGVSSTVSSMPKAGLGDSPSLQAYPDWSFSVTGRTDFNCSDLVLISAYRLRIDSCNRLWILDAGISRSLEDYQVTCPPKILIVDLQTDQVVRRIEFPRQVLRGESLFTNLIIDETTAKAGTCDDVFVYITDTVEPAIVVYDSIRDVTWRVSHPAMYPDPDFAETEILNDRFVLMDGIVGLTFDAKSGLVYFQPMATDRIFSVHKDVLRAGPIPLTQVLQVKLVGKKSSQGIGMLLSPTDGNLIFSPMSETAIATWNPTTNKQSILAYDPERLQFVADIITPASEPGVLYIVSSRFHRFFLKTLNPGDYNTRILRIELPAEIPTPTPAPTAFFGRLPSYSLTSLLAGAPSFGGFHKEYPLIKSALPSNGYFIRSRNPYSYDTITGIVNYTERNPFLTLNQGESFPPSKAQRNSAQPSPSFLDKLNNFSPAADTHIHTQSNGLSSSHAIFGRASHVLKREEGAASDK